MFFEHFKIVYQFEHDEGKDLSMADEWDLTIDSFTARITFFKENKKIEMMGWIDILDFVLPLHSLAEELAISDDMKKEYPFTESDSYLFFHKTKDTIKISSTWDGIAGDTSLTMPFREFFVEIKATLKKVILEILDTHPEVKKNPIFLKYMKIAQVK